MSYRDGKNVPGSCSPYTVWLRSSSPACVVGIDYRNLNDYITMYNSGACKYVEFWSWLSCEAFFDEYTLVCFDPLWNDHNANMTQVIMIKHT